LWGCFVCLDNKVYQGTRWRERRGRVLIFYATTQLNLMSQAEQTLAAGDLSRSLPGV